LSCIAWGAVTVLASVRKQLCMQQCMGPVLQSASGYSRTVRGVAPLLCGEEMCSFPLPCSSSVEKHSENIVESELGYGVAAQIASAFLGLCIVSKGILISIEQQQRGLWHSWVHAVREHIWLTMVRQWLLYMYIALASSFAREIFKVSMLFIGPISTTFHSDFKQVFMGAILGCVSGRPQLNGSLWVAGLFAVGSRACRFGVS